MASVQGENGPVRVPGSGSVNGTSIPKGGSIQSDNGTIRVAPKPN